MLGDLISIHGLLVSESFQDYSPVKDFEALSTESWPQNTEKGTDLFSVPLIRQLTS